MSNGLTHSNLTIGLSIGVPLGYSLGYFLYPNQLPSLFGGMLFGLLFTPDHDVDAGNISYLYIRKVFGTDFIWKWWWYPYARGIRHRSWLSHLPVLSTVYRYIYTLFPLTILLVKNDKISRLSLLIPSIVAQFISIPLLIFVGMLWYFSLLEYVYPFILGNTFTDTFHYLTDIIS